MPVPVAIPAHQEPPTVAAARAATLSLARGAAWLTLTAAIMLGLAALFTALITQTLDGTGP